MLYFWVLLFTQVYLTNKIKNKLYGNVFGLIMPLVNCVNTSLQNGNRIAISNDFLQLTETGY